MSVPPSYGDDTVMPVAAERSLTLSEERIGVSTVRVPARRVRLEKYVVTETRTMTVQVSREEVRLVDVELTDTDLTDGPAPTDTMSDAGRWLTLSEERVVVTTETVPIERVRLEVSTVVEDRIVSEDVRREQVTFDSGSVLPRDTDPGATFTPTPTEERA
jgi:uncharacterized protein (TIGR02271 family)